MNTLFDLIPVFCNSVLVSTQLNVAAVLETAYIMVPFSTPLCIKLSISLRYFVRTVIYSANRYLLLCLVVNLIFHLLYTFYMMVGSLNITLFFCVVSACSSNWQVSGYQVFKACLEWGVFILITTFFFCCYLISVHIPVPCKRQDVQPGLLFSALFSWKIFSLWKEILLKVGHWGFSVYWRAAVGTMFWLLVGDGEVSWATTIWNVYWYYYYLMWLSIARFHLL